VQSRKTVTILFTDMVGSTALGERRDPEIVRRVMTTYFDRMRELLERHGGTVEKYIGDAIVAVFGIPEIHEDDALRAVRAAAEMRTALDRLNTELDGRYGVRIETRTGINTGEILADDARSDAPLSADAANLAARLEQAASAGEILLGESTYRLVRNTAVVEPVGLLVLKGKTDSQRAWRLVEVPLAGRETGRRLDSPIVGRDGELTALRKAFDDVTARRVCRLVTIIGPPGVGKSRVCTEFVARLRPLATVLQGRCLPYGSGITYWPVADVVREASGITSEDAPEEAIAKIAALLRSRDDADAIAERLGSVLGLSAAAPGQETSWAVRSLLETLASQRPLVVMLDDVHWGEPTFLDLVEYLAWWSSNSPILLVCSARPDLLEARPAWASAIPEATTVRLDPLTEHEAERLIENLLGPAPLEREVRAGIRRTAEGNPLFVEEILRMLVDDGLLRRGNGQWIASADLSEIHIPPTINALLSARLERLSHVERAVIQRASVVGKVFSWGAITELSPEPERPAVGGHLHSLVRRELIRPDRSRFAEEEDAFRFSHILIRDAAYAATTKETRAELHERFAGWLEGRTADRLNEFEEVVGYHLEQAHRYRSELGDGEALPRLAARAAERLSAAGQRALASIDIPAAISLLSRATSLMESGDPNRIERLVDLAEALTEAAQFERARNVLHEAAQEAEKRDDDRLTAHVVVAEWIVKSGEGTSEVDRAEGDSLRAIEVLRRHADDGGLARAWGVVASARWRTGRGAAAEEALEQARRHAVSAGDHLRVADSLLTLSAVLVQGPQPADEAARRAEAILEEHAGNRTIEAYMSHALAHLRAWQGRFDEARRFARRYRDILRENGQEANWADSSECEGDVELLAGDSGRAVEILSEGQRRTEEIGSTDATVLPFLARALFLSGRWEEAEGPALLAIERAQPLWKTVAQTVLAQVRARQERAEEAVRLAGEAIDSLEKSDYLVFQGCASLGMAEVLQRLGRGDEAIPFRKEAVRRFEQKGAIVWVDRATAHRES
jgi:class 3 adenylate cyclase/tetratricopeptide (TPR) repeat protein